MYYACTFQSVHFYMFTQFLHLAVMYLLQRLGFEHELLADCHKRKLDEQQWEEELILVLKRSHLQKDSAGRLLFLLYWSEICCWS